MSFARMVSVITPAYRPVPEYLLAAYESLRSQELPPGYEWEWVLQEDGGTGVVQEILPSDSRVHIAGGRRGAVALTRNLALACTRGELIKNLDGDDMLTPGTLMLDSQALSDPTTMWTTCKVLDLLPDGS